LRAENRGSLFHQKLRRRRTGQQIRGDHLGRGPTHIGFHSGREPIGFFHQPKAELADDL
jgi:hypothetical protein